MTKQTTIVVIGSLRVKAKLQLSNFSQLQNIDIFFLISQRKFMLCVLIRRLPQQGTSIEYQHLMFSRRNKNNLHIWSYLKVMYLYVCDSRWENTHTVLGNSFIWISRIVWWRKNQRNRLCMYILVWSRHFIVWVFIASDKLRAVQTIFFLFLIKKICYGYSLKAPCSSETDILLTKKGLINEYMVLTQS